VVDGNVNIWGEFFVEHKDHDEYENRLLTLKMVSGLNSASNSII